MTSINHNKNSNLLPLPGEAHTADTSEKNPSGGEGGGQAVCDS